LAVTFGAAGAPSQKTINLDALFATSLANYRRTLEDNISTSNPFFKRIKDSQMWKSVDGGTNLEVPLMYELGNADSYDGYDVLDTSPTDGITSGVYEWRQAAVPVSISRKEERQNSGSGRLIDLLSAKIMQAELGFQEFFAKMLFQGNGMNSGNLVDPRVSNFNASLGVNPLALLIDHAPTVSRSIGNINQSTSAWWQNKTKTANTTTPTTTELLQDFENIYNTCSLGAGGGPDLILTDQTTFEWLKMAIYHRTRHEPAVNQSFPFENITFRRATVVWDEFISDPVNNVTNTTTAGVAYLINSKFFQVKYDSGSNFINTPFQKPANQDAKVAHILWMGQVCLSNRRKHGVLHTIPRTFTIE